MRPFPGFRLRYLANSLRSPRPLSQQVHGSQSASRPSYTLAELPHTQKQGAGPLPPLSRASHAHDIQTRRAMVTLFNAALKGFCARHNLRFVDINPYIVSPTFNQPNCVDPAFCDAVDPSNVQCATSPSPRRSPDALLQLALGTHHPRLAHRTRTQYRSQRAPPAPRRRPARAQLGQLPRASFAAFRSFRRAHSRPGWFSLKSVSGYRRMCTRATSGEEPTEGARRDRRKRASWSSNARGGDLFWRRWLFLVRT